MTGATAAPRTGEVWLVDLEPVRGSERGGRRPVVVFQNGALDSLTRTSLGVPFTSKLARWGAPGAVFIPAGEGELVRDSIALAFQARALDRSRFPKRLGRLGPDFVRAVAEAVLVAFGIRGAA